MFREKAKFALWKKVGHTSIIKIEQRKDESNSEINSINQEPRHLTQTQMILQLTPIINPLSTLPSQVETSVKGLTAQQNTGRG